MFFRPVPTVMDPDPDLHISAGSGSHSGFRICTYIIMRIRVPTFLYLNLMGGGRRWGGKTQYFLPMALVAFLPADPEVRQLM